MYSMTGFGRVAGKIGKGRVLVELRTVNHRYSDVCIKTPPKFGPFEMQIRELVRDKIKRGRVDLYIKELNNVWGTLKYKLNTELAKDYVEEVKRLRRMLKLKPLDDPLAKANYSDFLFLEEPNGTLSQLWPQLKNLILKVIAEVNAMRLKEGKYLVKDQKLNLKRIYSNLLQVKGLSDKNKLLYDEQMRASDQSLGCNGIELYKQDVAEEVTRLFCHLEQYGLELNGENASGRKIDFLIQEMNREFNTIGAKSNDAKISQLVVQAKSDLERLREQVQNLE